MGSGKTAVGKVLARRLALPFVDTDAMVERAAGMAVSRLFRLRGEPVFRRLESRAVSRAARGGARVVATGGGATLDPRSVAAMRRTGVVVWLKVPFAAAFARIERDGARLRPLVLGRTRAERRRNLKALFIARARFYRAAADFAVVADAPPARVAELVLQRFS